MVSEPLETVHGDLLAADVGALVNPVNTVGVMGKGLALQFRRTYPDLFAAYRAACARGEVAVGHMHVWPTGRRAAAPRYVIDFPTKRHWRSPSRLEDIDAGLVDLVQVCTELELTSIAVPPLGAGLGGLSWSDVRPRIVDAFRALPTLRVLLFEPFPTP